MCGHIVGLMHCINSTNDPKGSIILSNMKILFNFLCLVVSEEEILYINEGILEIYSCLQFIDLQLQECRLYIVYIGCLKVVIFPCFHV